MTFLMVCVTALCCPWVMRIQHPNVRLPKHGQNVARAMGQDIEGLTPQEAAQKADRLRFSELAAKVGRDPCTYA